MGKISKRFKAAVREKANKVDLRPETDEDVSFELEFQGSTYRIEIQGPVTDEYGGDTLTLDKPSSDSPPVSGAGVSERTPEEVSNTATSLFASSGNSLS